MTKGESVIEFTAGSCFDCWSNAWMLWNSSWVKPKEEHDEPYEVTWELFEALFT